MKLGMRVRGGLLAALIMWATPFAATLAVGLASSPASAQTVDSIQVEGNRRVETATIRSYFKPGPGGKLDQGRIDDGLKGLIETGLFQDVKINQAGGRIVVTVIENPVIGRVVFEGNKKVKDEQLSGEIQSKPRGTLSRPMVQSDAQRIADIYRHAGRYDVSVVPEIIEQPNNRVDLIFTVTEGNKTGINSIEFVGNVRLFVLSPEGRHQDARIESLELPWRQRRLRSGPHRSRPRSDSSLLSQARLRRRAGCRGADRIRSATGRAFWLPSRSKKVSNTASVPSIFSPALPRWTETCLPRFSRVSVGSLYNAEALEKSVEEMQIEASRRGFAFAVVKPRGDRNFETHTVSIVFAIDEGPRTYIERINVRGNTRTRDYVIRREFDISEGDAYNRALVDRAERRLKNLDFFKSRQRSRPSRAPRAIA